MLVRRLKLFSIVFIFLAVMIALAACSDDGDNKTPTTPNTDTPSTTPPSTAPADTEAKPPEIIEDKDPVELTIHAWFISPSIQATIDKFVETYPWITVTQNSSISGAVINNIIAGEKSDIVFLDAGLSQWISGGNDLLVELTPFIDQDERIQSANIVEGLMDSFKVGGKQYTLPFSDIPMWIAINKDMLSNYGLDMPDLNWTYDDMLELARAATDRNANDWGMYGVTNWIMDVMPIANGNASNFRLMGENNVISVADQPGVLEDMQWLQDLIHRWNVQPTRAQAEEGGIPGDPGAAFVQGNILMMAAADWDLPTLELATFDWDFLPFPMGKERQITYRHIGPMSITKASENQEEAFMFMSFLFSEEAQKEMIKNGSAAWVLSPELENFYDEVEIFNGRNTEVIKMSSKMGQYGSDSSLINLVEYQESVTNRITKAINDGGNFSDVIPFVEEYNNTAAEVRAELGM